MHERIKSVRDFTGLNQTEFADRISISRSALAKLESGVNNPSEQTIKLICREFGVSYYWLKMGTGPMMIPQDELKKAKVDFILDGNNEFVKQVFYGLADMPEEWWEAAEKMLRQTLGMEKDR